MDELKSLQKKERNAQKSSGSSRRRRRKKNSFVEFLQMYGKYIIMALVAILVVVTAIIVVGKLKKDGKQQETPSVSAESSSAASELKGGSLEKDGNQAVNKLVNDYFTALQNCDVEALSGLVNSSDSISAEQLQAEREFVENYQNIACYTLNGPSDGTYIVYVAYDMKFLNVGTAAPCLIRLYVCTNDQGALYIYNQDVGTDNEVAAYMEEVNAREDVKALMKETDDRLTEAMASDEALNALVTKLYGGQQAETTEAETPAETTEAETPAETTEAETPAETTPAASGSNFTDVDETVYAKENVKIRRTPAADGEEAGTLAGGQSIHRTGYNDNWSRVEYNGETCYIAAGFLTTTAPGEGDGFTSVDETVYAKESVRIRKSPDANAEVVGTLLEGESLKRTGYNDSWSRVIYDGETCYIGAGFLTTAKPSED